MLHCPCKGPAQDCRNNFPWQCPLHKGSDSSTYLSCLQGSLPRWSAACLRVKPAHKFRNRILFRRRSVFSSVACLPKPIHRSRSSDRGYCLSVSSATSILDPFSVLICG